MLGGCAAEQQNLNSLYSNNNWAQQNFYTETEEQRIARRKREEEEEVRVEEEKRLERERILANRPKVVQYFTGSVFSLASSIFFLTLNLSFHNHDYYTCVASAVLWFLFVAGMGATVILGVLGFGYTK